MYKMFPKRTVILSNSQCLHHLQNPLQSTIEYVLLSFHVPFCPLVSSFMCLVSYLVNFSVSSIMSAHSVTWSSATFVHSKCPNTAKRGDGCQTKGNTLVLGVGGCGDRLVTSLLSEFEYSHTEYRRGLFVSTTNGARGHKQHISITTCKPFSNTGHPPKLLV
jgi:hypothetical protein